MVAHSQGGNFALEAVAQRPELFRGVVVIEPASAPESIGKAAEVPHLVIWGDFIEQSQTWIGYKGQVDRYFDLLASAGCNSTVLELPAIGLTGNSHVPMMDSNSDEIATQIYHWIERQQKNIRNNIRPWISSQIRC